MVSPIDGSAEDRVPGRSPSEGSSAPGLAGKPASLGHKCSGEAKVSIERTEPHGTFAGDSDMSAEPRKQKHDRRDGR